MSRSFVRHSTLPAILPLSFAATLLPALAVNYDWDNGGGTGDWNLATNWSPDGLPTTGDNVFLGVDGGALKVITLAATPTNPTILEVGLARTGNGTATVNQTGGSLTVTGWFNLGQGFAGTGDRDGTGIWNMSGNAVLNATHANGGLTTIGAGFTPTGYNTGILSISGNAHFNQTANAIHVGGEFANLRARGIVNLSDNGKLTNTSTLLIGVAANGSTGVVNMSGTSTLTASQFYLGTNNGAVGAVNQTGGSAATTASGANTLGIGNAVGGFGSYRISAGSLTSNEIGVGSSAGGSGILDISGSGTTVTNSGWLVLNRSEGTGSAAQNAVLNVSGGSLAYNGGGLVANWGGSATNAQLAVINVSGTGSIVTGNNTAINLGWTNNANNTGILNLNGGSVTPSAITGARGVVNFNGGTLRAHSDNGAFLTGIASAQVRAGGAVIDTNGRNVTIGQALLAPSGSGVTTIAVTDGGSGYVSAPILTIAGGTGSGATAVANMVDDGSGRGTFRIGSITETGAGNYSAAPTTITPSGGAPTTAATFGAITTSANVSGGLTKSGAGTLTLSGANTFTGAVTVAAGNLAVATGGQIVTGSALTVANGAATASAAVSGGAVARTFVEVGRGAGVGVLNVSSGSLSSSGEIWLGSNNNAAGFGAMNISGGSVTTGSWLALGRGADGGPAGFNTRGVLTMSNGNLTVGNGGNLSIGAFRIDASATSQMSLSGGTANVERGVFVGENANGILDISGGLMNVGTVTTTAGVEIRNTLNLRGGTLSTGSVISRSGGTSILNFNGGTLQARRDNATLLQGLAQANVFSGGVVIDTNGRNVTIGQSLLAPAGKGVTSEGLTVSGSGFATAPIVEVAGGGGTGATAVAQIDANGNLTGITITNPGTGYTSAPSFTLVGGGGTATVTGSAGLVANVSGGLTKNGAGILTLTGSNNYTGPTTVNSGTLLVNGNITSATTVRNTATLGGSGTVGSLAVEAGGTLAPGNSIDSLDASTAAFASGSIFAVEINSSAKLSDLLTLTSTGSGPLGIESGALLTLSELGVAGTLALRDRLTLIDYAASGGGVWGGGFFRFGGNELLDGEIFSALGYQFAINYDDTSNAPVSLFGSGDLSNGGSYVTLTVVPEPGVVWLGGLGVVLLLRRRR